MCFVLPGAKTGVCNRDQKRGLGPDSYVVKSRMYGGYIRIGIPPRLVYVFVLVDD